MHRTHKLHIAILLAVVGLLLEGWALYVISRSPQHWRPTLIVKDQPAAHALYDAMIQALGEAQSLSYTSICSGPDERVSTAKVLLQKPGCFRVEVVNGPTTRSTTLVGTGDLEWVFWSGDRPFLRIDDANSYGEAHANVYLRKAVATGNDSLGSEIARLGITWYGPLFDPSAFHGLVDPLEPYRDGIRSRGKNRVGHEECDVIEISFLKAQRTRYLWLSPQDHLPRRIKEVVRTATNRVVVEEWADLSINPEIPGRVFVWSPPPGWRQWDPPEPQDSLLKVGQEAPTFALRSAQRGTIRLSDYRGKVVWLYLWQVGAPLCREEMSYLQTLYARYKDKDLVVLGLNSTDDRRIATTFLRENVVRFPNILDSSPEARKVVVEGYGNRMNSVPLSYVIDPRGNVMDAWYGYDQGHRRAGKVLERLGLEFEGL